MSLDITILVTLLMKNEDVWLKIPSEELYRQAVEAFKVMGIDIDMSEGHKIRVNSVEGIIKKRDEETKTELRRRQQAQMLESRRQMFLQQSESLVRQLDSPQAQQAVQKKSLFGRVLGKFK